jgi:hypothetical protein
MTTWLRTTSFIVLAVGCATTFAWAADEPVVDVNQDELVEIERGERPADDPVAGVEALPSSNQRRLSPLQQEIQAQLEAEDTALAQLQAELVAATDARQAHEIQGRIAELKTSTELALLRIQLRYAQERQDLKTSQQLEEAIEALENPPVRAQPQPRPAPASRGQ